MLNLGVGNHLHSLNFAKCRERAEQRRLKRAVRKEERGAARELRKDAAFLATEREKEKVGAKAERRAGFKANAAWLQQLESDFKSGGQGGMFKKKRKK